MYLTVSGRSDLEDWGGLNRASFNAIVSDRDQVEYYFPAWRAAVQGGRVGSVMCSYNAVGGIPSCANGAFLNGVLRESWGFSGLVVSVSGRACPVILMQTPPRQMHAAYVRGV